MYISKLLNPKPKHIKVWFEWNQNIVCVTEKQNIWSDISSKAQTPPALFAEDPRTLNCFQLMGQAPKSLKQQL